MVQVMVAAASTYIFLETVERVFGLTAGLTAAGAVIVGGSLLLWFLRKGDERVGTQG